MFRFFRSIWIWTASTLLVLTWVPLLGLIWLFDKKPALVHTARWFRMLGRIVGRVTPWIIHVDGEEHIDRNQVYVIVSNHQSLADIPLISFLHLDAKWLAKAELFKVPVFGWMMQLSGDVPVERTSPQQAARALLRCGKYLRDKVSVIFFPEGSRSVDGTVQAFNEGAFSLALREKTPILPLVIHGTSRALPRASWMFSGNPEIWLRVLPPVSVEGRTVKQGAELCAEVRGKIMDGLAELQRLEGAGRG